MTTPRGALIALLAAASLVLPATASAAVRYVSKAGADNASCSVGSPCLTIGHAVSVANADDTVRIGPGSYDEAVVADDPLHFEGSGAGSPDSLITPGTTRIQPLSVDGPAIEMHASGSVQDLQLVGKANPSPTNRAGLLLKAPAAGNTLNFVVRRTHAFGGETGAGTRKEGIRIDDDATGRAMQADISDLTIAPGATDDGSDGLIVDGDHVRADLDHVTVRPLSDQVRFPLWVQHGGELRFVESTMVPTGKVNIGLFVDDAHGFALVDRSDLRADGRVVTVGNAIAGGAQATITNSVVANVSDAPNDPAPEPAIIAQNFSTGQASLFVQGSTVLSRRAQPEALSIVSSGSGLATIHARNSILRATSTTGQGAPDVHLHPGNGAGTFDATTSNYSSAVIEPPTGAGSGTANAPGTEGNLAGDPGFADEAGGDLRLGAASPVVDRGDPALVAPAELDLAGGPRSVDGDGDGVAVPDMGAYERSFVPTGGGGGVGSATAGDAAVGAGPSGPGAAAGPAAGVRILRFALARRRFAVGRKPTAKVARRKRGTAFKFALSSDATVRVALKRERRCRKRPVGKRRCTRLVAVGGLTRRASAGSTTVPFSGRLGRRALKPGRYRATLVATGADGSKASSRTLRFRVI